MNGGRESRKGGAMKVFIEAEVRPIRAGIEASARTVALSGHGFSDDDALDSLRRSILAWCSGLHAIGELDRVLDRRGIKWTDEGESLNIELRVAANLAT